MNTLDALTGHVTLHPGAGLPAIRNNELPGQLAQRQALQLATADRLAELPSWLEYKWLGMAPACSRSTTRSATPGGAGWLAQGSLELGASPLQGGPSGLGWTEMARGVLAASARRLAVAFDPCVEIDVELPTAENTDA